MAVNISIIAACNNNCDYCFQKGWYHDSGKILSYEEIEDILYWSKGAPEIRILGGEPTLHPDIVKINRRIAEEFELGFFTNLLCDSRKLEELLKINYIFWLVNTTTRDELVNLFDENIELLNKYNFPVALGATLTSDLEQDEKYIRRLCELAKKYPRITKNLRVALATPCPGQDYKLVNFDNSIKMLYEMSKKDIPYVPIGFDCAINGCEVSFECYKKIYEDFRTADISFVCDSETTIDVLVDKTINYCCSVPQEMIPIKNYYQFENWHHATQYLTSIKRYILQNFSKVCSVSNFCKYPICQGVCFAVAANLLKQSGKYPELFKYGKD